MSKWLANHINTNVFFKIAIRKRYVYIDIGWSWIWNQCSYLGIWNYDCKKMIVLPSFQRAIRLIHKTQMKLKLLTNSDTLICIWKLVFPIGIIEVLTSSKCFWLYFSSLHEYWPPSTWNSLVYTSWGEMERCEKRAFQLLKMRIKKISWNINPSA